MCSQLVQLLARSHSRLLKALWEDYLLKDTYPVCYKSVSSGPSMALLLIDSWKRFRPYGEHITSDFLISGWVWVLLFCFEWLRITLPIHGWTSAFILSLHGVFVVISYISFFFLALADIRKLRRA